MAGLADLLEVLNKDAGFAKLLQGATEDNSLLSLGFDLLDAMMVAHLLGVEYEAELQLTKNSTLGEIVEQINQHKPECEERSV
ncbi:hypothetical protein WJ0W_003611 [Paenibacillus melissococcoides]|uniref:Carrier domain-containing protein n=1 Tax=Paenibacillus melissococcoides TaxID=2912268 RepID=A0ABN8U9E8_9BACL|nr:MULTISPECIES: hypothetical protein [Paenibacillus]MEB9895623.1 hypothetical protein [Bacillus cereus]CAH8246376.1 hypothetical protein WJ0W_003611 [Paenibacillus melissococcoides]CAH8714559.1 hypothetical protein HTL2_003983 [Paenibacillus melissococcoides]CAH8715515.1 hypothetical protein WDD9_004250 [Paenibacillus melissococcoides]GIO78173.1 hypothetical protein J6TS7_17830 [Paenibacillus dendritiformis]